MVRGTLYCARKAASILWAASDVSGAGLAALWALQPPARNTKKIRKCAEIRFVLATEKTTLYFEVLRNYLTESAPKGLGPKLYQHLFAQHSIHRSGTEAFRVHGHVRKSKRFKDTGELCKHVES